MCVYIYTQIYILKGMPALKRCHTLFKHIYLKSFSMAFYGTLKAKIYKINKLIIKLSCKLIQCTIG